MPGEARNFWSVYRPTRSARSGLNNEVLSAVCLVETANIEVLVHQEAAGT